MRIAQVSPLYESVPPKAYGGTERVVSYLTEELVARGHDVTLFASGDSVTEAKLIPTVDESMRQSGKEAEWLAYFTLQMGQVAALSDAFDIIHFHTGFPHFPIANQLCVPNVTTLHDRQDLPEFLPLYKQFPNLPLVSISNSQRMPLPKVRWVDTVYHGLPPDMYAFCPESDNYFVFLGRISPAKRVDRAIEIAERCGVPLYVGAKIDKADAAYFNESIKPLFDKPCVHYLGEVGGDAKRELLQHARALLFPIDWPEPFGLVMIEAFSCGTPVIAYRNGAVPEVMEHGVTGYIVDNQEEAVEAANRIDDIDRKACREVFERRFTAGVMAENYLRVYRKILTQERQSAFAQPLTQGASHG